MHVRTFCSIVRGSLLEHFPLPLVHRWSVFSVFDVRGKDTILLPFSDPASGIIVETKESIVRLPAQTQFWTRCCLKCQTDIKYSLGNKSELKDDL